MAVRPRRVPGVASHLGPERRIDAAHDYRHPSANQTAQAVHEQLLGRQCKVCKLKRGAQAPEARGDALAKLARARGMPGAALWRLAATDGSAWFFRGATWHASVNRGNGPRLALQMHYMPARCAFRRHDSHQLAVPRASDLHVELPPVVPLLGRASPTLASPDGTLRNNWLLLDETEPVVVDAPFDATKVRVRGARKSDLQSASVGQRAHNLSAAWAAATCAAESGVDPRAGLVDLTKCKKKGPNGHTAQLRIIEYHTSKLRRNNAAHELREHEEVELLYMLHGHVIVTLRQGHPHERVLYRRLLRAGDVAYYPGWQSHSLLAVEDDHAPYLATRYLGSADVPKGAAEPPQFWSTRDAMRVWMHDSTSVWTDASLTRGAAPLGVRRVDDPAGGRVADRTSSSDLLLVLTSGAARIGDAHLLAPATLLLPAGSWPQGDAIKAADATTTVLQFEFSRPGRDSSPGAPSRGMRALGTTPVAATATTAAAGPAAEPEERDEDDGVVHLCVVAMGKAGAVAEAELLLRSVRATSTATIALHLVVSSGTQAAAEELIRRPHRQAWHSAAPRRRWSRSRHSHLVSSRASTHRFTTRDLRCCEDVSHLFLPNVRQCIYIDTDMLMLDDVAALWAQFADFGPRTLMQLPLTDIPERGFKLSAGRMSTPSSSSHMCSCISLMHLERMRGSLEPLLSAAWAGMPEATRSDPHAYRASNQGLLYLRSSRRSRPGRPRAAWQPPSRRSSTSRWGGTSTCAPPSTTAPSSTQAGTAAQKPARRRQGTPRALSYLPARCTPIACGMSTAR